MPLLGSSEPDVLPDLNTETWYRLSNSAEGYALDVVNTIDDQNGKIELRRIGDYSGQHWRLQRLVVADPNGDGDDLWALDTMYLGEGKRLDVYGNDPRTPHLANRGNYYGQRWIIEKWPGRDEFKLSNTYGGQYLALDTRNTRDVVLSPTDSNSGTQRWKLTPIRSIRG